MAIPVNRPTLRRKDLNGVLSCLVSDRIGPGELNAELAGALARRLEIGGGVCLSTYAAGIDRALDLLGLARGDSLAMSALTPGIYRDVCARRGIHVALVDVEADSPLLDVGALEGLLSAADRPKALVLHYTFGFLPNSDDVLRLGIPIVEDVSHALGGRWNGGPCGSHGQVALLSLRPEGIITAGEGAAVLVRERKTARGLAAAGGDCEQDRMLPDMNAALGLAQLRELDRFLRARQEIAEAYLRAVARSPHGALVAGGRDGEGPENSDAGPARGEGQTPPLAACHAFAVTVRGGVKEVRQYASRRGVETRRAFADAVLAVQETGTPAGDSGEAGDLQASGHEPAGGPGGEIGVTAAAARFPRAYELLLRALQFPLYPALAKKDIQLVTKVLASLP